MEFVGVSWWLYFVGTARESGLSAISERWTRQAAEKLYLRNNFDKGEHERLSLLKIKIQDRMQELERDLLCT